VNLFPKLRIKLSSWKHDVTNKWHELRFWLFPAKYLSDEQNARILPLGYCYPDELFVDLPEEKPLIWAEVIPGFRETYRFKDSDAYYRSYQHARFGFTWKKGGWECLRHYEIIANGCFPVFRDLDQCPADTLAHLPKPLLLQGLKELLPWRNTPEQQARYREYSADLLTHAKENSSCSAVAKKLCDAMGIAKGQKVLFLTCDPRVNYSRELLFIGLNRLMKESGGACVSYPKIEALYTSYPETSSKELYGLGFGYSRRLIESEPLEKRDFTDAEIQAGISNKEWDFILYGKVGHDEWKQGAAPNLPFWSQVFSSYDKSRIGFIYGGDAMQFLGDMKSPHARHLAEHSKYGYCFVRELSR